MRDELLMLTQAGLLFEPPLSASRVRQLVDGGKLPALRTAKGYRLIRREDVLALIEQRRRERRGTEARP
jgi:hypothetical protein